ncbi:hydantoinase/oxoprolinase [Calocera viscosa TUFC12733]|uniref:Hydantoinase/oxoprolinase n=1 Tax=Calocera viscosa (strain TUFC12733) TaxID=1330018 RepID=A0A167HLL2_CALVF|nr:hydantoinase/oxoprolinase [Calocera viscosa TUFC12733]
MSLLRIGVDVGGTNTDGVLIDVSRSNEPSRGILAYFKAPTTPNVSEGIEAAVRTVLDKAKCSPKQITSLTIGTTHFINAVLEQDVRRLQKVAVIRLCGPYTRKVPPFIDFPPHLRDIMLGYIGYVDGGLQIDGSEILPIVESQIVEQCKLIKEQGLTNIVLVGVFSTLDTEGSQELRARGIVQREMGEGVNVVCSSEVGQIGLLERENASILNASILTFAQRTMRGFKRAMHRLGLTCPLFLTQNDGTLTTAAKAAALPIRTFASGQTNSMRGASYLAGLDLRKEGGKSVIVCDVGGTTCDVGVLLPSGFPRQAAAYIEVGGVRTSFAMPDLLSIGLGGGSRVRTDADGKTTVGPDSVGHWITRDAMVFGGDVLTTTDVAVALGRADVGDASKIEGVVSPELAESAQATIKKLLENVIDRMKTTPEDATVLMVGGGSIIVPDELDGVGEILRPPFFGVANAVGAAMAKVAGEVDTIEILQGKNLADVLDRIKKEAVARAIMAGGDPNRVSVVDVQNLPVQYVTNQATRIIVKATGELSMNDSGVVDGEDIKMIPEEDELVEPPKTVLASAKEEVPFDVESYRPYINEKKEWILSERDLELIALGTFVLGTGGGGTPYPPMLICKEFLREGKVIKVVDAEDVPEDALFARACFMGSPSVSCERLPAGTEITTAMKALTEHVGISKISGTISDEIGGGNGIVPLMLAAELNVPAMDGDLMGRAYPNMNQCLPGAFKIPGGVFPAALADGVGNSLVMHAAQSPRQVEIIFRNICTTMGSRAGVSVVPLTRKQCQDYGVVRTVSQAWRIGRAITLSRQQNDFKSIPRRILELQNGKCLFIGKIVDVQREVRAGFTWGQVTIAPLQDDEQDETSLGIDLPVCGPDDNLTIPFQNENLAAFLNKPDGSREILITVPDLLSVLDSQSGANLGTQEYRYGLRVTVMGLAGDPKWTQTKEGMETGGPSYFGLDIPFVSVGTYKKPKSVIREYGPSA